MINRIVNLKMVFLMIGTTFTLISGQMLKAMRDARSLSQTRIAKALDTSVMSISRLEKGDADLTLSELEQIAHFFTVQPGALLDSLITVKTLLIKQGCTVLADKHALKKIKEFKKIDRLMIYELCVKFKPSV